MLVEKGDSGVSGALAAIEELRVDSKVGKGKHFSASDRKLFWHRVCGVPVILANLFVGIVLVSFQGNAGSAHRLSSVLEAPVQRNEAATKISPRPDAGSLSSGNSPGQIEWIGFISIFLAFSAASLSAVQTFFNFHKASEGHRSIGNRYTHISRQCKALQQKHKDNLYSPSELWMSYEKLYDLYHQINTEAEAFPTSPSDLKSAKRSLGISPYENPNIKD